MSLEPHYTTQLQRFLQVNLEYTKTIAIGFATYFFLRASDFYFKKR